MPEANSIHPPRDQLCDFVAGKLSQADRAIVETHVAACEQCCEVLRSLPHDTLIHKMRLADTSFLPADTKTGLAPATGNQDETTSKLPPELANHPRYRIVRQLGAGGMGVVYEAVHRLMGRHVALKVISRRLVNSREAIERFHLEVKAAAMLSHPNIVTAYDAEQAGDLHFLVMEFIDGTSLSELVQQRGRLSVLHACNFAMQAAKGLQHALEHGMVHRDIKPQNLMRSTKGTIKILDFGLARLANSVESARLTKAGSALGTADYIAPEQVQDSRNVDIRADIYSLGCTLYYLLAGHVPYPDGGMVDKVLAHMKQSPGSLAAERADIPSEVIEIVERMMAKDPAGRFQTPAAVVDALKPFGRPHPASGEATEIATQVPVPPPPRVVQPRSIDATDPFQHIDPFEIPFADLPAPATPAMAPPARRPRKAQAKKQWIRYGVPVGVLVLLVLAGFLLKPGSHDGVWIDLMPRIDPTSNAAGQWQKSGGELTVDKMPSAWLVLPTAVPEHYDFEVSFTRNSGADSIALFFVAGSGRAIFDIDAWGEHLAGIQCIGDQTLQDYSTASTRQLHNGTRYTALVRVRRDHVTVYLDGELLATYEGGGSDLSVVDVWQMPSTRRLAIGAYDSATTFHGIRVRPVGTSRMLP